MAARAEELAAEWEDYGLHGQPAHGLELLARTEGISSSRVLGIYLRFVRGEETLDHYYITIISSTASPFSRQPSVSTPRLHRLHIPTRATIPLLLFLLPLWYDPPPKRSPKCPHPPRHSRRLTPLLHLSHSLYLWVALLGLALSPSLQSLRFVLLSHHVQLQSLVTRHYCATRRSTNIRL